MKKEEVDRVRMSVPQGEVMEVTSVKDRGSSFPR